MEIESPRAFFDDRELNNAARVLIDSETAKSPRVAFGLGESQEFRSEWRAATRNNNYGDSEAIFFQNESNERFVIVAPTATVLLFLDSFLGVDAEFLCEDAALWRGFCEELQEMPKLTALERKLFYGEAARLGVLCPGWYREDIAKGTETPRWRARVLALKDAVETLDDNLYWERRAIELKGRVFPWAILCDFSVFHARTELDDGKKAYESLPEAPEVNDGRKTMIVRIASGTAKKELLDALRPGDILKTDAPADSLFDAVVDGVVVFRVRPGMCGGRMAVQIKEKLLREGTTANPSDQ